MSFALTFISTVFSIIFSDLFVSFYGVLLLIVSISALFSYVRILFKG